MYTDNRKYSDHNSFWNINYPIVKSGKDDMTPVIFRGSDSKLALGYNEKKRAYILDGTVQDFKNQLMERIGRTPYAQKAGKIFEQWDDKKKIRMSTVFEAAELIIAELDSRTRQSNSRISSVADARNVSNSTRSDGAEQKVGRFNILCHRSQLDEPTKRVLDAIPSPADCESDYTVEPDGTVRNPPADIAGRSADMSVEEAVAIMKAYTADSYEEINAKMNGVAEYTYSDNIDEIVRDTRAAFYKLAKAVGHGEVFRRGLGVDIKMLENSLGKVLEDMAFVSTWHGSDTADEYKSRPVQLVLLPADNVRVLNAASFSAIDAAEPADLEEIGLSRLSKDDLAPPRKENEWILEPGCRFVPVNIEEREVDGKKQLFVTMKVLPPINRENE